MYRMTGIGTSLVLIAAGAVLAWAVTADADGVDLNRVGVILFIVGIIGLLLSMLAGVIPSRSRHVRVTDGGTGVGADQTVVERDRY